MKYFFLVFVSVLPVIALAASGGIHHIPWDVIKPQLLNFSVVCILIVWVGRKHVAAYFTQRHAGYADLVTRAEKAKSEAESHKHTISERLSKLEKASGESIEKAKAEAAALKSHIIKDAEKLAEKLEKEAGRAALFELERAKNDIRNEMMQIALTVARKTLADEVDDGKQQRLQTEFVEKIQVVR